MTTLVTGGAEGIGAGIAERLAAEGLHVIADRDEQVGAATAARPSARWSITPGASSSRAFPQRAWRRGKARLT